jgi:hypothetical protein
VVITVSAQVAQIMLVSLRSVVRLTGYYQSCTSQRWRNSKRFMVTCVPEGEEARAWEETRMERQQRKTRRAGVDLDRHMAAEEYETADHSIVLL